MAGRPALVLFPLTLTPFEYYYWCDDRLDYPTSFPMELWFRGRISRPWFQLALQVALRRHPLLNARVESTAKGIPRWLTPPADPPAVNWHTDARPLTDFGSFLDLTQSAGLRIWVRIESNRSRLVMQFHHACCDALGALRFVEDLLVAYASLAQGGNGTHLFRPIDIQRLRSRGDFGLTESGYTPNLRDSLVTARLWGKLLLVREPTLLAPHGQHTRQDRTVSDELGYHTLTLQEPQVRQLRSAAIRRGVTMNDLMLRDLFLTVHQWNREHGHTRPQRLKFNVPVSLRLRADQLMPAANVLGFWFVARDDTSIADANALLQSIHEETDAVKKWRLPLYFLGGLGIGTRFPRLMSWALHRNHSFATLVFSNPGRVLARTPLPRQHRMLVCGDLVLERLTGVPPIRPGTRAAIAVVTYGTETTVNLRCDPTFFDTDGSRKFHASFVTRLLNTIQEEAAASR